MGVEDGPGLAEGGDGGEGAGAQAVGEGVAGGAGFALGGDGAETAGVVCAGEVGAGRLAGEGGVVGHGGVLGGGIAGRVASNRIIYQIKRTGRHPVCGQNGATLSICACCTLFRQNPTNPG